MTIFIVAPCILKIHQLLKTNKCTNMYCVYSKTRINSHFNITSTMNYVCSLMMIDRSKHVGAF
jgi:hypothetical protein